MNLSFSSDDGSIYIPLIAMALAMFIIFPLVQKIIFYFRLRRQLGSQTIIAMYESPRNLSPAEIGYMYDSKIDKTEIIGTLFDLEYRHIITIDRRGNLALSGNAPEGLKDYEILLTSLIKGGELKSIHGLIDPKLTHGFNQAVRSSLVSQGFMNKSLLAGYIYQAIRFSLVVAPSTMLLLSVLSLFVIHFSSFGQAILFFLAFNIITFVIAFPIYVLTGIILAIMYVQIYGTHWIGTKKLRSAWPEVEGFKLYIKEAQLDRLLFTSSELKQASKERDYGYAVALGMDLHWQARFAK